MNEKPQKWSINSIKSHSTARESFLFLVHPLFQLRTALLNEIIDRLWIPRECFQGFESIEERTEQEEKPKLSSIESATNVCSLWWILEQSGIRWMNEIIVFAQFTPGDLSLPL